MKLMDKKFALVKIDGEEFKELNITEIAVTPDWWNDSDFLDEDSIEENGWAALLTISKDGEIEIPVDNKNNVSVDGDRNASTKNVEDHPIFDKFFEDWREVTFENVTTI